MTEEAKKAATQRGNDLLLPLNLSVDRVLRLALSRNKFPTAAAAKQWVLNHGFGKRNPVTTRFDFVFEVSVPTDFEDGSLRPEKITPDIEAVVGDPPQQVEEAQPTVVEETPERKILEIQTGVWGGHSHTARFDDQAGNGRTGPPSDSSDEHSHEIIGFQLQASDGHNHTMRLPDVENSRESRSIIAASIKRQGELWVTKQDAAEDEVRMFGIVSKPEVPDAEGSVISEEEIRQANDLFMRDFQTIGFMHQKAITEKVQILQNVIAPIDIEFPLPDGTTKRIAKGTWYQELYSKDADIVSAVREGRLTGLSIGGFAKRVPISEDGKVEEMVTKSKVEKAEGDPIKERLVNLRVEEVSLVDAAANEEEWFIVKRLEKAVPSADASNEDKRAAQKSRSEKYGIEALENKGENLTFPSGQPTSEADYGDPVNLKYQMGDEAHARNARARFKQAADTYSQTKSKRVVHERIVRRELRFGIDVNYDPNDPLDQMLPSDLKDRLTAARASKQENNMEEKAKVEKEAAKTVTAEADAGSPADKVEKKDGETAEVTKSTESDASLFDKVAKVIESAVESLSKKLETYGEITKDLGERIGKVESKIDEHGDAISKAAVVKAAAKGDSVPEGTEAPQSVEKEAPTSLWAGSAIYNAIQRQRRS